MTQYDMVELSFKADAPEASHVRIPMNAVIRNEKSVWQLDGFYAGNRCYKLRFLPEQSGIYYYSVQYESHRTKDSREITLSPLAS